MPHNDEFEVDPKAPSPEGQGLPYKYLKQRHPDYKPDLWRRTRAFYAGGERLLGNDDLMREVFPQHNGEDERVYQLRRNSAHYINYAGEIVDHFMAKLAKDPLRFGLMDQEVQPFYKEFEDDCAPGLRRHSFDELVRQVVLDAFQTRRGYMLVDMAPRVEDEDFPGNLADQEASGMLNVWCVPLQAESLVDWERNEDGEYTWALTCFATQKRASLAEVRGKIKETYTMYTRDSWMRWEIEYFPDDPPKADTRVPMTGTGGHTFGRVPILCFELPEGLWAMGKLESLAKEHFNKRNAMAWAEAKALLPVLYEFLDNDPVAMAMEGDGDERAVSQPRSPAHVQVRMMNDKVEWVAPTNAPFTHALESTSSLRDEMHRVEHQMAMAADTRGALIRRSGESKKSDERATLVIMDAVGDLSRDFARDVLDTVAAGRGDGELPWAISGYSDFAGVDQGGILEQESVLDTAVDVPSPTFKRLRKFHLAKTLLGDSAGPDELEDIKAELDDFYSPEIERARNEIELGLAEPAQIEVGGESSEDEAPTTQASPSGGVVFSSDRTFKK